LRDIRTTVGRNRQPRKKETAAMPRYKVTLTRTSVEIVEAANQFQAAIVANEIGGDGAQILSVTPAVGRPTAATGARSGASAPASKVAKVAKKRRPLSPEAKAKLAQNLVKARAARAAKRKATAAPAKKTRAAKKRS
jgi:hypothetical protein